MNVTRRVKSRCLAHARDRILNLGLYFVRTHRGQRQDWEQEIGASRCQEEFKRTKRLQFQFWALEQNLDRLVEVVALSGGLDEELVPARRLIGKSFFNDPH